MNRDDILNIGLALAMEFGKNWLQPIQSRLAEKFPNLTSEELDEYNSICQAAMKFSNELISSTKHKAGKALSKKEWEKMVINSYAWINSENLKHLFSQAMYYAWKEGLVS